VSGTDRLALWPSVDLRGGRVVRLLRGEWDSATLYDGDPVEVVARFGGEGADGVHVVDLDAAFGRGDNRALVSKLVSAAGVPVQVGGGLRDEASVARLLGEGAARAVLGSLPFTDPAAFGGIAAAHPGRIVVALDCRDGRPSIKGWTEDSGAGTVEEALPRLVAAGVEALLVTDVSRDGAMTGPGLELLSRVRKAFAGEVIASGGVRGEEDLPGIDVALAGGPRGAILGRALHDGTTSVARLRAAIDGAGR
jgi:phosphoribosylformimino-5-aminoimidazole carboxamide ribotide isomerase